MLSPFADDSSPSERRQKPNYRFPYRRDSVRALIAASGYHENVARSADLALSQPRLHAKTRIRGGRQRFSQIENVFLTERRFVESPEDVVRGIPTGAHAEVRDRRALAECLLAVRLFSILLTLRWNASRQSERCRDGDLPTFGCLDEDSLGDAARRRVFLRYGVAVCTVDDAWSDRVHTKVARHQGVGPRRVSTRTPSLVAQLESSRPVARQRLRMEIRR